jgi:hypothetical protein
MLRLYDIESQSSTAIEFHTEEITAADIVVYVMYDTSTGNNIDTNPDYYSWRATTVLTSTAATDVYLTINDSTIYPSYETCPSSYANLDPRYFKIMSYQEYQIINNVLVRLDLVRRRLPNPGTGISSVNGVGQNGIVSYVGGFEKKMTIDEIGRMMEGTIVELNMTPPQSSFWPAFSTTTQDIAASPYTMSGFPYDMMELATQGTMIRCLIALGLLEVDISFSTSDSGLQLTFDRAGNYKTWYDALLTQYKEDKTLFKWNHASHSGIGVGTTPWIVSGIWGTMVNQVGFGAGQLALNSILGIGSRGNIPM